MVQLTGINPRHRLLDRSVFQLQHEPDMMTIRSRNFRNLPVCLLLGLFFFTLASISQARNTYGQEAVIRDFTVSNSEDHLLLYLTVSDWFSPEMEAAIQNGIPITFAFNVEISALRNNWPDKKIKTLELSHVLEYDSLKKEYHINRDERTDSRTTASLEEAKNIMSEINGFKLLPLNELYPDVTYVLRVKARLARKTMPLYFHYLIPFSSPWDFETEWQELTLRLAL